jgi:hypothetical protein
MLYFDARNSGLGIRVITRRNQFAVDAVGAVNLVFVQARSRNSAVYVHIVIKFSIVSHIPILKKNKLFYCELSMPY